MELGLNVRSTPWKGGFAGARTLPALAQQLRETIAPLLPDGALRKRLHVGVGEQGVLVHWHPVGEGMHVDLLADGRLAASVTTSAVGPGYHAFVVQLLERIADDLQVQWQWDALDGGDNTGYAPSGDFTALQHRMFAWLQALATQVLSLDDVSGLSLNLSTHLHPQVGDAVATPLGPLPRRWFAGIAEASVIDPVQMRQFFPWWDQRFRGSFWDGCACAIAWSDLAWVTPRDEYERTLLDSVLEMVEQAQAMESTTAFPEAAVREIEALSGPGASTSVPAAEGIGYRRGEVTFQLFSGWSLRAGGWFRMTMLDESEVEGGETTDAMQLDDGTRAIHISSMSVDDRDGIPMSAAALHAAVAAEADMEWRNGPVFGSARWDRDVDSKHLYAAMAVDGRMLLLTITDALEAPADWAEAVARSAFRPQQAAAKHS